MFQACKQLRTNCIIETEATIVDMEKNIVTEMATVEAGGKGGQARIIKEFYIYLKLLSKHKIIFCQIKNIFYNILMFSSQ